jgi:hypothetical protein
MKNAKICPKLTFRGEKCDKKSDCQFSHPSRCSHFAKFGIVSDFPKGKGCSWEVKCRFAHVKVCKKTTCPKVDCKLTHLQPKPKSQTPKSVSVGRKSNSVPSARWDAVPSDQQAAPGKRHYGNNNNKSRPNTSNSHHQTSRGPFLGQTGLNPQSSMEEMAKMVTQMVLQSLNSMQQSQVPQMPPQLWGVGARWQL